MESDIEITDLQFQILCSYARDLKGENTVIMYGSTAQGYSVCLTVTEKQPDFYIQIPDGWTATDKRKYQQYLTAELNERDSGGITIKEERHKSFWDFTNGRLFRFLRVQTRSKRQWIALRERCLDKETSTPIPYKGLSLMVFEANIDPMLRFFHERELPTAGWVTIGEAYWSIVETPFSTATINATAVMSDVHPASPDIQLSVAPYKLLSWDIECTSSHGDFPLAIKTWRKPAREAIEKGLRGHAITAAILAAIQKDYISDGVTLSRIYLKPSVKALVERKLTEGVVDWPSTVDSLDDTLNAMFSPPEGDPIIQIGSTLYINGAPVRKEIFVLGTCERLPTFDAYPQIAHPCKTETDVIRGWCQMVSEMDPDFLVGYNTSGFDNKYLWERATICNCTDALSVMGRLSDERHSVTLEKKFLGSSAMGDSVFYNFKSEGRLHIDLLAYVRRNAVLDSYSLDKVTATFMSGVVKGLAPTETNANQWNISTKSTKGTAVGRYIVLMDEEHDVVCEKLRIVRMDSKSLQVEMPNSALDAIREHQLQPVKWAQVKDDVNPQEIFALQKGTAADRTRIAAYCLQDCDLVMELMQKLEVLNNAIAMANVCWVPLEYIFSRGQGIKAESLMFYECRKEGQLIPVLPSSGSKRGHKVEVEVDDAEEDAEAGHKRKRVDEESNICEYPEIMFDESDGEGYEGAIVLDPVTGIYLDDDPVSALDFSSLYPSTAISENYSHDTLVSAKDYDLKGRFICIREGGDEYDNLPGCTYASVPYDILKPDPKDTRKHPKLVKMGVRICRYIQTIDGKPLVGTLCKIWNKLLSQRKATRKLIGSEPDEFRKSLLEAKQLAYKLTANSMYGQLGSATFKIRRKVLAASITAHGRSQILFSKASIEAIYGPDAGDPRCAALCVYGDTDSVFVAFRPRNPITGERLRGREAQEAAKALTEEAGHLISGALKAPHDFEFDKMFRAFCLLSKKRYVGDMTEGDRGADGDFVYDRKSMGIVMKRRDNAPIVKYVYGGVVERILVDRDVRTAFTFVQTAIRELLGGRFPVRRLTITKSLKAEYKQVPAHKVLAERIGKRDPGNKPASNDRIPFVYVLRPGNRPWPKDTSQGDRIETPTYMQEKGLKPDYGFYISNQIAKPVAQVFALVLESLPGFTATLLRAAKPKDMVDKRQLVAEQLLFGDLLREASGQRDIRSMFGGQAVPSHC